jgi:hypothetical protein
LYFTVTLDFLKVQATRWHFKTHFSNEDEAEEGAKIEVRTRAKRLISARKAFGRKVRKGTTEVHFWIILEIILERTHGPDFFGETKVHEHKTAVGLAEIFEAKIQARGMNRLQKLNKGVLSNFEFVAPMLARILSTTMSSCAELIWRGRRYLSAKLPVPDLKTTLVARHQETRSARAKFHLRS